MSRKRKRGIVVGSEGRSWDLDDFDLDSHGFVAPLQERFESLMQGGFTPEQVSVDIREKYAEVPGAEEEERREWDDESIEGAPPHLGRLMP